MQRVFDTLFQRAVIGLPAASANIDDAVAQALIQDIGAVQESLDLLELAAPKEDWRLLLQRLLADDGIHPMVRGRSCRLLFDQTALDEAELQRQARLALSPAVAAAAAAGWAAGLLQGSGLRLLHQDGLWVALDAWIDQLTPEVFVELLPLLRRAFSDFTAPERRGMGEKVKNIAHLAAGLAAPGSRPDGDDDIDHERAALVLPVLARILGVDRHG
jgi:hypothetical protein